MTSNDMNSYIREDVFNARMDALMSNIRLENEKTINAINIKIDNVKNELRSEIKALDKGIAVNTAKIEMLQHTFYWGFSIMAAVIALLALIPYFNSRKERREEHNIVTAEQMHDFVEKAIAQHMSSLGK